MKKEVPLIFAQECNDEDDIDSLLDASLHEQNLSSHGAAKFLSVYDLRCKDKRMNESYHQSSLDADITQSSRTRSIPGEVSNGLGSTMDETVKTQNSCLSVTGTEVRVVRRDSTISAVTLGESGSKRIDSSVVVLPVPDSPSPPGAIAQDSDSSCSFSTTDDKKKPLKRRSSFASEPKMRRRSISFNQTVDKVTYDETSWNVSQTSELLDGLDVQERGPTERRLSSLNTSSLAVIEDESPPTQKKKKKGQILRKLIRRKKK